MKKIISVVLVLLMLVGVLAVSVSAAVTCTCGSKHTGGHDCLCCVYCPDLPAGRIVSCAKRNADDGVFSFCCDDCRGFIDADRKCGCSKECPCCCLESDTTVDNGVDSGEDTREEDEQQNNENVFLALLKKILVFSDLIKLFCKNNFKFK